MTNFPQTARHGARRRGGPIVEEKNFGLTLRSVTSYLHFGFCFLRGFDFNELSDGWWWVKNCTSRWSIHKSQVGSDGTDGVRLSGVGRRLDSCCGWLMRYLITVIVSGTIATTNRCAVGSDGSRTLLFFPARWSARESGARAKSYWGDWHCHWRRMAQ